MLYILIVLRQDPSGTHISSKTFKQKIGMTSDENRARRWKKKQQKSAHHRIVPYQQQVDIGFAMTKSDRNRSTLVQEPDIRETFRT